MKPSVVCKFFEATGNQNCPFHRILSGDFGYGYYAVKRVKRKRRKYGKSR